ncbi:hypothetical protein ACFL0L_01585 [Patescibacteria group bacterium]
MNDAIKQWLEQARAAGLTDEQITEKLLAQGYTREMISEILNPSDVQKSARQPNVTVSASNKSTLIIIVVVVFVILAGLAVYFLFFNKDNKTEGVVIKNTPVSNVNSLVNQNSNINLGNLNENLFADNTNTQLVRNINENIDNINTSNVNSTESTNTQLTNTMLDNWLTYTNDDYSFSFEYPDNLYFLDLSESGLESTVSIYDANRTYYSSEDCLIRSFEIFSIPADCMSISVMLDTQDEYTSPNFNSSGDYSRSLTSETSSTLGGYAAKKLSGTEQTPDSPINYSTVIYNTDTINSPQGEGSIIFEISVLYGADVQQTAEQIFTEVVESFSFTGAN